jgi:hypothetical protein
VFGGNGSSSGLPLVIERLPVVVMVPPRAQVAELRTRHHLGRGDPHDEVARHVEREVERGQPVGVVVLHRHLRAAARGLVARGHLLRLHVAHAEIAARRGAEEVRREFAIAKPPVSVSSTERLLPRALPLVIEDCVKSPGTPGGPDCRQFS